MTSAGENFKFTRKARVTLKPGYTKKLKPFTDMEIAQLDALIKKNLNELFEPL